MRNFSNLNNSGNILETLLKNVSLCVRAGGGEEGTTQEYSPMNKALILLIYKVKMVSSSWQVAKIN